MKSKCGILLKGALVASAFVALLIVPLATLTQADGVHQPTTVGSQKHETALDAMLRQRIAEGYAVMGPIDLAAATSSTALVFPDSPNEAKTINLKNKKVSVLDESGNASSMSSVTEGKRVIVCQKKDEVVIYLVKGHKKGADHAD
jgi:hypothetical protein